MASGPQFPVLYNMGGASEHPSPAESVGSAPRFSLQIYKGSVYGKTEGCGALSDSGGGGTGLGEAVVRVCAVCLGRLAWPSFPIC